MPDILPHPRKRSQVGLEEAQVPTLRLTSALQPSADVIPGRALLNDQVKNLPTRAALCWMRPTPTCCSSTAATCTS